MTTYIVKEFDHRSRNYKTFRVTAKDISECRKIIIQKPYHKEHQYEIWNGNRFVGNLIPFGKKYYADWQINDKESDDRTIDPITGKIRKKRY